MDYRRIPDQRYPDTAPPWVVIQKRDITTAVPRDPVNCVAAKAFTRAYHVKMAIVMRTKTALVFERKDGKLYVEHFGNEAATRLVISATDVEKQIVESGLAIGLRPLRLSDRPERKRISNAKRPSGNGAKNPGSRPKTGERGTLSVLGVRHGAGFRFDVSSAPVTGTLAADAAVTQELVMTAAGTIG